MNEGEIEDILTHSFFQDELRLAYSLQPLDRLTSVLDQDDVHTLRELLDQGTVVPCYAWPSGRTLVHQAAALDAVSILSLLTEEHSLDVDIKQAGPSGRGQTPLYYAVMENRLSATDWLVQHGARTDCLTANEDSAIMVATICGHERLVEHLLKLKVNPNKTSRDGDFPLWRAASSGSQDILRLLLDHAADVNQVMPVNSMDHCTYQRRGGPVLNILTASDKFHLADMVISNGADVNAADGTGRTPLFNAVIRRNDKLVDLLLERGCDVNMSGPILVAVALNRIDIIEKLLAKGADINLCHSQCGDCYSPLTKALCSGSEESVQFLLERGADPNLECCEYSEKLPLYFAIQYPFQQRGVQLVKTLLDYGVNIFISDKYFGTPLFMSAYLGHQAVVTLLVHEGADLFIQEPFGDSGETPLGIAFQCHQLRTAELLSNVVVYFGMEKWLADYIGPQSSQTTETAQEVGLFSTAQQPSGKFRDVLCLKARNPPLLKTICRRAIRQQIGTASGLAIVDVRTSKNPGTGRGSVCGNGNSDGSSEHRGHGASCSNSSDTHRLQRIPLATRSFNDLQTAEGIEELRLIHRDIRHFHSPKRRDVTTGFPSTSCHGNKDDARGSEHGKIPQSFSSLVAQLPLPKVLVDFISYAELAAFN